MSSSNRVIYTSIPRYISLRKSIDVRDYKLLPNYSWAKKRVEEMSSEESSFAEEVFMDICNSYRYNLFRQVFFRIDGKCYFLDFFITNNRIAIEIDGSYHKRPEIAEKDRARDAAFRSIGIRTIRFTTEQMRDPEFREKYLNVELRKLGAAVPKERKITPQQLKLQKIIAKLSDCPNNCRVEVRSDSMPLLRSISHGDTFSPKAKNKALLGQFYDLKREKGLAVLPRFTGNVSSMKKHDLLWVAELERKCLRKETEMVIITESL